MAEHLLKRRLDLGLRQRDVAPLLKVDLDTYRNWERSRSDPYARSWPAVIQFLGYDPLPEPQSVGQWIAFERTRQGIARKGLARMLGWDENTLQRYEEGRVVPGTDRLEKLRSVLGSIPSRGNA